MRTIRPIVYASVVGLLLACSDDGDLLAPPNDTPGSAFQVSPATATLQPGQTFRFATTYSGDPALMGTPGHVAWQSSDDNVATVTGGMVRAVRVGQAKIVAIWSGYRASAIVRVVGPAKKHEDAIPCLKRPSRAEQRLMAQC